MTSPSNAGALASRARYSSGVGSEDTSRGLRSTPSTSKSRRKCEVARPYSSRLISSPSDNKASKRSSSHSMLLARLIKESCCSLKAIQIVLGPAVFTIFATITFTGYQSRSRQKRFERGAARALLWIRAQDRAFRRECRACGFTGQSGIG